MHLEAGDIRDHGADNLSRLSLTFSQIEFAFVQFGKRAVGGSVYDPMPWPLWQPQRPLIEKDRIGGGSLNAIIGPHEQILSIDQCLECRFLQYLRLRQIKILPELA
jgi:hypothetical protein